jgi:hypothetical protein
MAAVELTLPLVAAGVYHRSVVDEPVRGLVTLHVLASIQIEVAVVDNVRVVCVPSE